MLAEPERLDEVLRLIQNAPRERGISRSEIRRALKRRPISREEVEAVIQYLLNTYHLVYVKSSEFRKGVGRPTDRFRYVG